MQFAIVAKRTGKVVAAAAGLGRHTWTLAIGMESTERAVIDYPPDTWLKSRNITCVDRRTRAPAERISSARTRR